MKKNKLTIFTATYNRAYCLPNLYKSLIKQTNKSFEWIIVDDNSTDDTKKHVDKWIKENKIEIKYFYQNHGGKYRALNKGFEESKCEYFFTVDSDDYLLDNSVEVILKWIENIKDENIGAVSGLRVSPSGEIVGGTPKFTSEYIDATNFEREKYNLFGDKAEVYKTELLRKNKFPEFENEYFCTEDVVYQEIAAKGYKIRWYNIPIYVCEYLDDGLSKQGANAYEGHIKNYKSYCYYVQRGIKLKPFEYKYSIIKEYILTNIKGKIPFKQWGKNISMNMIQFIIYVIFVCPISFIKRKVLKVIRGR